MTAPDIASLTWPLVTLDFEASSLDQDSYPIEVGIAVWRTPESQILGWSTLIASTQDWLRRGHRNRKAAALHGISDDDLSAYGRPAREVAAALDALLGTGTVAWCDGGDYDRYWLDRLYAAARSEPRFQLGDWPTLVGSLGSDAHGRVKALLAGTPARHRARADAEALLQALSYGLGIDTGPVGDLATPLALANPP